MSAVALDDLIAKLDIELKIRVGAETLLSSIEDSKVKSETQKQLIDCNHRIVALQSEINSLRRDVSDPSNTSTLSSTKDVNTSAHDLSQMSLNLEHHDMRSHISVAELRRRLGDIEERIHVETKVHEAADRLYAHYLSASIGASVDKETKAKAFASLEESRGKLKLLRVSLNKYQRLLSARLSSDLPMSSAPSMPTTMSSESPPTTVPTSSIHRSTSVISKRTSMTSAMFTMDVKIIGARHLHGLFDITADVATHSATFHPWSCQITLDHTVRLKTKPMMSTTLSPQWQELFHAVPLHRHTGDLDLLLYHNQDMVAYQTLRIESLLLLFHTAHDQPSAAYDSSQRAHYAFSDWVSLEPAGQIKLHIQFEKPIHSSDIPKTTSITDNNEIPTEASVLPSNHHGHGGHSRWRLVRRPEAVREKRRSQPSDHKNTMATDRSLSESSHDFVLKTFYYQMMKCGVCREFLLTTHGYYCRQCQYICHKRCVDRSEKTCALYRDNKGEDEKTDNTRENALEKEPTLFEQELPIKNASSLNENQTHPDQGVLKGTPARRIGSHVPHSFKMKFVTRPAWCAHCGSLLMLGKQHVKCRECHIYCHAKCQDRLPLYCGLSKEMERTMRTLQSLSNHLTTHDHTVVNGMTSYTQEEQKKKDKMRHSIKENRQDSKKVAISNAAQPKEMLKDDKEELISKHGQDEFEIEEEKKDRQLLSKVEENTVFDEDVSYDKSEVASEKTTRNDPIETIVQPLYQLNVALSSSSSSEETEEDDDEDKLDQEENKENKGKKERSLRTTRPFFEDESAGWMTQKCFSDYDLVSVIGKGNFGKVMLVQEKASLKYFAMKVLKKAFLLENDEVDAVMTEKRVFHAVDRHPFLVNLHTCFQSEQYVYFVMEFVAGGDLMFHIQQTMFSEAQAKFYAAEILLALEFLHRQGIVYRDLKLDNILLSCDGHVKLADYGLCKENMLSQRTTRTFCGTPEFIAPEILREEAYGMSVDWWGFGVLLYEMLVGQAPFKGAEEEEIFEAILRDPVYYPVTLSLDAVHLLRLLLQKDPAERLGCGGNDADEVKSHPFFQGMPWDVLLEKLIPAPCLPQLTNLTDTSYFDEEFTRLPAMLSPTNTRIHRKDQLEFQGIPWSSTV